MERSFDEPASPYLRKMGVNHTNQKFFLKTRADGKDDMILNIDSMNMAD